MENVMVLMRISQMTQRNSKTTCERQAQDSTNSDPMWS